MSNSGLWEVFFCYSLFQPFLRIDRLVGSIPDFEVQVGVSHDGAGLAKHLAGRNLCALLHRYFFQTAVKRHMVSVVNHNAFAVSGHIEGLDNGTLEDGFNGFAL